MSRPATLTRPLPLSTASSLPPNPIRFSVFIFQLRLISFYCSTVSRFFTPPEKCQTLWMWTGCNDPLRMFEGKILFFRDKFSRKDTVWLNQMLFFSAQLPNRIDLRKYWYPHPCHNDRHAPKRQWNYFIKSDFSKNFFYFFKFYW